MVANMKVGTMDAFCVGEPWNAQLVNQRLGYTAPSPASCGRTIRRRCFAHARRFRRAQPERHARHAGGGDRGGAVVRRRATRPSCAAILGRRAWFNVPPADILPRLQGIVDYGDGRKVTNTDAAMKFWRDHASYPFRATTSGSSPRISAGACCRRTPTRRR
jgi:nitrate/nitrite transport system substrate-binding protein